ncbi:MAG: hypothetical protein IKA36_04955 [Clostridia bacterium]|nr:hypothetical protein [Clostridia bacterium]
MDNIFKEKQITVFNTDKFMIGQMVTIELVSTHYGRKPSFPAMITRVSESTISFVSANFSSLEPMNHHLNLAGFENIHVDDEYGSIMFSMFHDNTNIQTFINNGMLKIIPIEVLP